MRSLIQQGLEQKMQQKMRLSQFQQQSLHMLQSSAADLLTEIEELRAKYPELQWTEGRPPEWEQGNVRQEGRRHYPGEWRLEHEWQNGRFFSMEQQGKNSDAKQQLLENFSGDMEPDLREVLREQIYLWQLSPVQKEFCELVLQNLDERGLNLENPLRLAQQNSQKQQFAQLLQRIQRLEPLGCACDSPVQSLSVQAQRRFPETPLGVILRSLPSLESFGKIEDLLDYFQQEGQLERGAAEDLLRDLQELEPYPARGYKVSASPQSFRIYPEIQVEETGGVLEVELLNTLGAKLLIVPPEQKETPELRRRHAEAEMILQQLQRREETLLRIAKSVFSGQGEFVRRGIKGLHSLTLQQVAENISLHASTVSRCIQGKYCKTPWGTYPLRFFFTQGAESGQSREQIKEYIIEILQEYSLTIPQGHQGNKNLKRISDVEICDRLQKFGIQIARRTVNKYRAELRREGRE